MTTAAAPEDTEVDLVIIGSGGGALCAALTAHDAGLSPLVLEKEDKVGGNTALSGGVIWIPNSPVMARDGIPDSYEAASLYLDSLIKDGGAGSSPRRRAKFLREAPELIRFLEGEGLRFQRQEMRSDYYDELPGGSIEGRSLEAPLFSLHALGEWAPMLRLGYRTLPIEGREARHLVLAKRTVRGALCAMLVGARVLLQRLGVEARVGVGAAVAGQLLEACLKRRLPIWRECAATDLLVKGGKVVGVKARNRGREIIIHARKGVLVAAGGFAHNAEMRAQYLPQPSSTTWTSANPGECGDLIAAALALGAAVEGMDRLLGVATSFPPDAKLMAHTQEFQKPFGILVDQAGRRFANEAGSYVELVQRIYARNPMTPTIPCWFIMDARHRAYYPFGMTAPGHNPQAWLASGYLKRADTISSLATLCEIDPTGLEETIRRWNGFAATGRDEDFQRGDRSYDRYFGDPRVKPNPTLGPISKGPFYAVAMYPGDVGTFGGLVTDEHARVLTTSGYSIEGLYATGTATASVFGSVYPGAGGSVAASCVFGRVAAKHCAASINSHAPEAQRNQEFPE